MSQVLPEGTSQPFVGLGSQMPTPNYGEPAAPAPPAEPAAPPEPEYAQIPAEEWQGFQQVVQQQNELLAQLAPLAQMMEQMPPMTQNGQTQQYPDVDIWSDNPAEQIRQLTAQVVDERLAPYQETFQHQQLNELEASALDQLHAIAVEKGEFIHPTAEDGYASNDMALEIAKTLYPQTAREYGEGPRAEQAAYEQAYEFTKAYEQSIIDAYENRAQNQASTLAAAPREPGPSGGMPAAPAVTTTPGGFESVLQKHFGPGARLLS